ncbi:MAG: glucosamine-6-phosphate deaminase, partial [Rhodothermales bacterium]
MLVEVFDDYDAMSERAAELVTEQIRRKPDSVIGFATGGTPLGMYERLIKNHHERGLDFSKITTFNLDEYIGLPPTHPQSYHHFMWEHLFDHINVNPSQVYVPHGMADDVESFCAWYERQIAEAGGIDLQILGIGANGHLAFNEPGSSLGSR